MKKELPKFKSLKEESDFWDDPRNVEEYFADAEPVEMDFTPAREAKKKRPKGVVLYEPRSLRKAG